MKPICRLRTCARAFASSVVTSRPSSKYSPTVGESSRPRIDSSVDLPQPDGPEMAMYSPRSIFRFTSSSACVRTSSVSNTRDTPFNSMTVFSLTMVLTYLKLKTNLGVVAPCGGVRQHNLVAGAQFAADDFHLGRGDAT